MFRHLITFHQIIKIFGMNTIRLVSTANVTQTYHVTGRLYPIKMLKGKVAAYFNELSQNSPEQNEAYFKTDGVRCKDSKWTPEYTSTCSVDNLMIFRPRAEFHHGPHTALQSTQDDPDTSEKLLTDTSERYMDRKER